MKPVFRIIPLVYFTGLSLFWIAENYMTTGIINYIAVAAAVVFITQLFVKNKIVGIVSGVAAGLFCGFMLYGQIWFLYFVKEEHSVAELKLTKIICSLYGMGLMMAGFLVAYYAKKPFQHSKQA